jgi:hypothetical protein
MVDKGEIINKETTKMVKENDLMTKTETLVREIEILIKEITVIARTNQTFKSLSIRDTKGGRTRGPE